VFAWLCRRVRVDFAGRVVDQYVAAFLEITNFSLLFRHMAG
jgi:hypothetical protein